MSIEIAGASLKARPLDFAVRENFLVDTVDEHLATHNYVLMRKCGYTTIEAVVTIAEALSMPSADITYSGLKDEDAVTEQLLAFPVGVDIRPALREQSFPNGADRWLRLAHYGFGAKPLTVGHLAGNTFQIALRKLSQPMAEALTRDRTINLVFLNYYDVQRFGIPGKPKVTHRIGDALLSERWQEALDLVVASCSPESAEAVAWAGSAEEYFATRDPRLINFYLASLSSRIWNETLIELISKSGIHAGTNVDCDEISFSFLNSIKQVLEFTAKHANLPYTRMVLADGKLIGQPASRPTAIQAIIQIGALCADGATPAQYSASIGFSLPSGSYGTMALRQLTHFLAQDGAG